MSKKKRKPPQSRPKYNGKPEYCDAIPLQCRITGRVRTQSIPKALGT